MADPGEEDTTVVSLNEMDTEMTPEQEANFRREIYKGDSAAEPIETDEAGDVDESAPAPENDSEKPDGEEKPVEDPEKSVPDGIKTLFESLSSKIDGIGDQVKRHQSEIGGITNRERNAKREAEKPPGPTEAEIAEAAESAKALDDLSEEYPEWGKAFKGQFADIRRQIKMLGDTDGLKGEIAELKKQLDEGGDVQTSLTAFFHPDYLATIKSEKFTKWLPTQTKEIQEKIFSASANDAVEVLDLFDESTSGSKSPSEIAQERRDRLKAAASNPEKGRSNAPISEEHMSEKQFRNQAAKEAWPNL